MPEADLIADLKVREHQLIKHLLGSPEYLHEVAWRLKRWAVISAAAALALLGDGYIYLRERGADPLISILFGVMAFLLFTSVIFWFQTRCCFRRLNERWLTPEAKRVLNGLRMERIATEATASK